MPASDVAARELALLQKVQNGDVRRVEQLLRAGANVDGPARPTVENERPLLCAINAGNASMIKCLLKNGADVNAASPLMLHQGEDGRMFPCKGVRAVHVAVIHHHRECLKVLLDARANLDVTYSGGITPLMAACKMRVEEQGIEMVKELIEAGADPLVQDNNRWACLWYAINLGRTRTIQKLLSVAPETVHQVAPDGSTPLYMASGFGQHKAVSLLLSAGAKQTRLSFEKEKCPLDIAVRQNRIDVVRVLLSDGLHAIGGSLVLPQAICDAVRNPTGMRAMLPMLLAAEGDERQRYWARSWFHLTPLLGWAAASGSYTGVSVLLAAGANESVPDDYGRKPDSIIGLHLDTRERNARNESAIRRALKRGPAFRAKSWAWPIPVSTRTLVVPLPSGRRSTTSPGVHIYRAEGRKRFAGVMCR